MSVSGAVIKGFFIEEGTPVRIGAHEEAFTSHETIFEGDALSVAEPESREKVSSSDSGFPKIDVSEIFDKARQEGFSTGIEEAKALAENEIAQAKSQARSILNGAKKEAEQQIEAAIRSASLRVVGLALEIAKKIIKEEVSIRPETVLRVASAALACDKMQEKAVIRANPDDVNTLKQNADLLLRSAEGLREVIVKTDASIMKGGVIVEGDAGMVDCTVETQLEEVSRALGLPVAECAEV